MRNKFSCSEFAIDGTENPHPRFSGLMKSIRERRGEKVKILVPLFNDVYTSYNSDISITNFANINGQITSDSDEDVKQQN